jgi:hypothetical protein
VVCGNQILRYWTCIALPPRSYYCMFFVVMNRSHHCYIMMLFQPQIRRSTNLEFPWALEHRASIAVVRPLEPTRQLMKPKKQGTRFNQIIHEMIDEGINNHGQYH